ncbi:hypothetical protein RRG08_033905 [Elysia crispata]|uniref:Uncharacterized protein n=1 Tax=Elysia crispata TaxID=231223 RepID=A0AAE1EBT0_9GAST|nr:hypothetical protein RRG08_033905 [Elysia crispata]
MPQNPLFVEGRVGANRATGVTSALLERSGTCAASETLIESVSRSVGTQMQVSSVSPREQRTRRWPVVFTHAKQQLLLGRQQGLAQAVQIQNRGLEQRRSMIAIPGHRGRHTGSGEEGGCRKGED